MSKNNFIEQFKAFLLSSPNSASRLTVKNYLSDIRHFISWFEAQYQELFDPRQITTTTIEVFKKDVTISSRSLERHLSSLRKFFTFLKLEGHMGVNPFEQIRDKSAQESAKIDPFNLKGFKNHLYVYNASHLTIKNYVIDVKQFIKWAKEVTHADDLISTGKINKALIEEYKARLINNAGYSPATINRKLSSLRRYLNWAESEGILTQSLSSVENIIQTKQPVFIPQIQIKPEKEISKAHPKKGFFTAPIRLGSAIGKLALIGIDLLAIAHLVKIANKAKYIYWKLRGQPVFVKGPQSVVAKTITADDILGIKNISKAIYAPFDISTKNFSLLQKIIFHARFTRPKWYKTYHSYAVTHYFHFAILVIFLTAVGFGIYTSFFQSGKPALAVLPTAPPRILSFQGRLTDNLDNPITSLTDLRFAIYNDVTASGAALLWQEVNEVSPDQDGIFNVILGSTTAIDQSVFAENSALWLGVTVEATDELTPRQRVATVAYAANAETLQGLLPITAVGAGTTNVVLALDSSGNLTIGGSANPTFAASGGQFKLSGQPLLLTTNAGSDANVQITTDDLGKIDLQKPILNSTNSNNISTAVGAVEVNDLFAVLATSSGQSAVTINQTSTGPIISASASGSERFTVANDGDVTLTGNVITASSLSTLTTSATLGITATTLNLGGGGNATIGTVSGDDLSLSPNGAGEIRLVNDGDTDVILSAFITDANAVLYTTTTGVVTRVAETETGSQCLLSGAGASGFPVWGSCTAGSNWDVVNGVITPKLTSTLDLLLGSQSTQSAKFAVIGINGTATPIASVSATGGSDATKGIYLKGDGSIQSVRNNTLTIGGNTTGNISLMPRNGSGFVGIGTTAPDAKLVIADTTTSVFKLLNTDTQIDDDEKVGQIQFYSSDGSSFGSGIVSSIYSYGTGGTGRRYNTAFDVWDTGTTNTALTLRYDGNVGLGTTSPISELHVTRPLSFGATGKALGIFDQIENQDIFTASAGGNTRFVIQNDGDVGIGTNNPASDLHVSAANAKFVLDDNDATDSFGRFWEFENVNRTLVLSGDDSAGGSHREMLSLNPTNGGGVIFNDGGLDFDFRIEGSGQANAFFVQGSDGNVGIGTAAPNARLEVQANATDATKGILVYDNSTSNASPYVEVRGRRLDANASQSFSGGLALAGLRTDAATVINKHLGTIYFGSNHTDGTESNLLYSGSISGIAEGTFSDSTTMPTGLAFYTGSTGRALGTANQTFGTERLRITNEGKVGLGLTSPIAELHVTRALSTGVTGKALAIFDQIENQDIFTASKSGVAKFTITSAGGIKLGTSEGSANDCLLSGGAGAAASFGSCAGAAASAIFWNQSSGALFPKNSTVDLLVGGQATTSAKFAVLNVNGTGPATASVSGNLIVMPRNGAGGSVGIGTTSPGGKLDVRGGTIEFDPGSGADATRAFNFNVDGSNYGKILLPSGSGGAMAFWTGSAGAAAERVRITNSGDLTLATGTTLTASSLTTFTTSATVSWGTATALTFTGDNLVLSGSDVANGNLTLQGTTNATRTTSYLLLQPNGGNVGIGTTTPGYGIDVEKATGATYGKFGNTWPTYLIGGNPNVGFNTYYNGGFKFGKGSVANYAGTVTVTPTTGNWGFFTSDAGNADATATMTERLTILQGGNVGIGTTGPDQKLDVLSGGGGTQLRLTSTDGSVYTDFKTNQEGDLNISPSGSDATISGRLSVAPITYASSQNGGIEIKTTGNQWKWGIKAKSNGSGSPYLDIEGPADASGNTFVMMTFGVGSNQGNVGIGDTTPASLLTVGNGDLFQVNSSGAIAAATGITSSGNITFSTFSTNGGLLYTNGSGLLTQLTSQGSANDCLLSGGSGAAASFGSCAGAAASAIYWNQSSGALFPKNSTVDLLVGGQATTSAKFAVLNVNSGIPTVNIGVNDTTPGALGIRGPGAGNAEGGQIDLYTGADYDTVIDAYSIDVFQDDFRIFRTGTGFPTFIITEAGYIGLGVGNSIPTSQLYVSRPLTYGATGKALAIFDQIENQDIFTASASGTTRFVIQNDGDVGIGTNTPANNLHIASTGDAAIYLEADTDNAAEEDNAFIKLSQDNNAVTAIFGLVGNAGVDPENVTYTGTLANSILLGGTGSLENLQLGTADTVRLTIETGGDIGIGTTNPGYPLDVTGSVRSSGEFIATTANQFRAIAGSFGSLIRNDGTNTYWLLTASGDQYGSWNTLRPFIINNTTGAVSINTTGSGATVIGNTSSALTLNSSATLTIGGASTITASSLTTFTTAATLGMASTTTLNLGTNATLSSAGTALNIEEDTGVDVNIAGTSAATGCTVTNSTGALTCAGNITSVSGIVGFWQRSAGNLFPATANDTLSATSAASTVATFTTNNPAGTLTRNTLIQHTGAGTVTSLLELSRTAGTVANGINLSGTMTQDISFRNGDTLNNSAAGTIALSSSTLTASSLTTFTTSASVSWGTLTSLTFTADNATIYGSDIANGNLTLEGTSNGTKTTSYVLLQPTGGNVGIGTTAPGGMLDIVKTHASGTTQEMFRTAFDANWGLRLVQNYVGAGDIKYELKEKYSGTEYDVLAFKAGNVGIGTTTPDLKLDVVGYGKFGGSDTDPATYDNGLTVTNAGGTPTSLFLWQQGIGSGHIGLRASDSNLYIVNSYSDGLITNSSAITLESGGDVGIGTTNPGANLEIYENVVNAELLRLNRNGTSYYSFLAPSGTPGFGVIQVNGTTSSLGFTTAASGDYTLGDVEVYQDLFVNGDVDIDGNDLTSAGDLTITPAGGDVNITGNLDVSGNISGGPSGSYNADRLFDFNNTNSDINTQTYTGVIQRTITGTINANRTDYGLYNNVLTNSSDDMFSHTVLGALFNANLANGYTIDNQYGLQGNSSITSSTLSPDIGRTATTSAGLYGTSVLNAAGSVTNNMGIYALAQNANAGGTVTTNDGARFIAYTTADGAITTTSRGVYASSYENGDYSSNGIVTGYGGYFTSQDATTTYGLYAIGIQNSGLAETFTNVYGIYGQCQSGSAGTTIQNCYGVTGFVSSSNATSTITNAYSLYVPNPTSTGTIVTNYGLYIADQTGGDTSDYGIAIAGADTQALWISSAVDTTDAANGIAFGLSRDTNLYRSAANTLATDDSLTVGGTTITASNLTTFTTSASVSWGTLTSLTFTADNATIYGSDAANGNLTLEGTSNGTKTTSYVNIQPTGGNVGIGTTGPTYQLSVNGNGQALSSGNLDDSGNTGGMLFVNDSGGGGYNGGAIIFGAGTDKFAAIHANYQDSANNGTGWLQFLTRTVSTDTTMTPKMTIQNDGDVGIGTATPGTYGDLEVYKPGYSSIAVQSSDGSGAIAILAANAAVGVRVGAVSNHRLGLYTNNNEYLTVGTTGLIGLGTTSPASELHVTRPLSFGATGKALAIFDQIENQDILTASASGTPRFTIATDGDLYVNSIRVLSTNGGTNTLFFGNGGESASGANSNTAVGIQALNSITSGDSNVAIGYAAGQANTTGLNNVFVGDESGFSNTSGSYNNFIGEGAAYNNISGSYNNFFGDIAGYSNTTGRQNVFIGDFAGYFNVSGSSNTIIGADANITSSYRYNATALGANAYVTQSDSLILGSIGGTNSATGSARIGIGTTAPMSAFHLTRPINGNSTATGKALAIFDQIENQDILTASKSGVTQFKLTSAGSAYARSFFDLDNSSYFLDPSATGTGLSMVGTTITASSLTTLTTSATVSWGTATALTFTGDNLVLSGSDVANGNLSLQGTTNATRTTSYVILQPTAGNVGIGTTAPGSYKLAIAGPTVGTNQSILKLITPGSGQGEVSALTLYSTFQGTGDNGPRRTADITAGYNGGSWGAEYLTFNVGGSNDSYIQTAEKMRIQANGNVGIGTTSPNAKLSITNNIGTSFLDNYSEYQMILYNDTTAATSYGLGINNNTLVFNSGGGAYRFDRAGNATAMSIDTASNVTVNGQLSVPNMSSGAGYYVCWILGSLIWNSTCSLSDARLKTDIQDLPVERGLDAINQLRPISFNWKDIDRNLNDGTQLGFLAQDLEELFPELVDAGADVTIKLPDGSTETVTGALSLNYEALVVPLVRAVQEIDAKVENNNEDLYITSSGDLSVSYSPSEQLGIVTNNGQAVGRISAFAEVVSGKIRVGYVHAQALTVAGSAQIQKLTTNFLQVTTANISELTVNTLTVTGENILIGGQNIRDYVTSIVSDVISNSEFLISNQIANLNAQNIISPLAEIDTLHTNLISPLSETPSIALKVESDKISILNGPTASSEAVITFDNQGNASLSGKLSANQLSIRENLDASEARLDSVTARQASISGTLRASRIIADQIEGLNIQASTVSANYITNNYYASTPSGEVSGISYLVSGNDFPTTQVQKESGNSMLNTIFNIQNTNFVSIATFSSQLAYVENLNAGNAVFYGGLSVYGPTTLSDTSIIGQLAVGGNMILADGSINVLGADLNLQPLRQGGLSIMAGLIYIDTNGNATFEKDATVKGTLFANVISPLPGKDLTLKLGSYDTGSSDSELRINNATGSAILAIDQLGNLIASGAANIAKLNINSVVSPALAVSQTEEVATGSAGTSQINAYKKEMTIKNPLVTEKSLIYITPTSNTGNQVLYLFRQVPGESFTVGIQNPTLIDIPFNWIIIN